MSASTELRAPKIAKRLVDQVSSVLAGKRDVVEQAVVALLARGHLLIEDVPGVGKTTLARALAKSVGVSFRRLQFTSDLMPADVIGGSILDPKTGTFQFRPGPVFTHVLLADEINRTTPRTQSALLEAMDERQVSVDGVTHPLAPVFFVVATQNPEEFYGTYPLPESQLDRFLMRVRIGYPPRDVERSVIANRRGDDPTQQLASVVSEEELLAAQADVNRVSVDDSVLDYLHALVLLTRATPLLELGASTRAALALERSVRAHALVKDRSYATPDDVKSVAKGVLAHRLRMAGASQSAANGRDAERIVDELLKELSIPL